MGHGKLRCVGDGDLGAVRGRCHLHAGLRLTGGLRLLNGLHGLRGHRHGALPLVEMRRRGFIVISPHVLSHIDRVVRASQLDWGAVPHVAGASLLNTSAHSVGRGQNARHVGLIHKLMMHERTEVSETHSLTLQHEIPFVRNHYGK